MKRTLTLSVIVLTLGVLANAQISQPQEPAKVFWQSGQPGSDEIVIDGTRIHYLSHKNITIGLFVIDTHGFYVVAVEVTNATDGRILFDPERTRLVVVGKNISDQTILAPLAPEKVTSKIRGRAKWGNFFRTFAAGMASRRATAQSSGSGSFSIDGPQGTASGTYSGNSTTTVTTPDYAAQRRAAEANARANQAAGDEADIAQTAALRANTVFPGQRISGFLFFQKKKEARAAFRVQIAETIYNFPLRLK